MEPLYFPFSDYWWIYCGFTLLVLALIALDLGVFHRKAHEVKFKEALSWSIIWISLALVFNYVFYSYSESKFGPETGTRLGLEFLTGFVVEKSLAVDNIFVFAVIFSYFAIPAQYQHRILFYGIIGALVFRTIFIALGASLMQYHAVVLFFGALLLLTGLKIIFAPKGGVDPADNAIIRFLSKHIPMTTKFHGERFLVTENGRRVATPLLMALIAVEFSDIIFAVDSVPAIFAITPEPLIVFTSNIFAILGLRAMYFLLAGVIDRFYLLKKGLGAVLLFVGLKMVWLNELFDGKFPIGWSLGIIGLLIGGSVILSMLFPKSGSLVAPKETING